MPSALKPSARATAASVGLAVGLSTLAGRLIVERPGEGLALAAALPAAMLGIWMARRPRLAFGVYLLVLSAVPVWAVEVDVGVALVPTSLAFLLVLPAVVMARESIRVADWWLLGFAGVSLVATVVYDTPEYIIGVLIAQYATAYVVGRTLGPAAGQMWTYRALALVPAAVAAWACLEFVLGLHIFEDFASGSSLSFWRTLQERGGLTRSEAAFGHAIALGGFVTIGIPFTLTAGFRPLTQLLLLAVLFAGLVSSLSRGPILGALLGLLLGLLFLPSSQISRNTRLAVFGVGLLGILFVAPRLLTFFTVVGGEETAESAEYRERLLTYWTQDLHPFGQADYLVTDSSGISRYRGFESIDNGWLLLGLQFGWVPLILIALAAVACVWRVLRRRAQPAEIALTSQLFILATVAQITQYGAAVWMLAGVAVGLAQRGERLGTRGAKPSGELRGGSVQTSTPVDGVTR